MLIALATNCYITFVRETKRATAGGDGESSHTHAHTSPLTFEFRGMSMGSARDGSFVESSNRNEAAHESRVTPP